MHLAWVQCPRRGDRIESRLERRQGFDQLAKRWARRGESLEQIEQVGVGRLAVAAFSKAAQSLGLVRVLRRHREKIERAVMRPRDVDMPSQSVRERSRDAIRAGDRRRGLGIQRGDAGRHQRGIVGR